MYFCDCHTHTHISNDSKATLLSMAEEAVRLGLSELYVTDHCDLLGGDGTPNDAFPWAEARAKYDAVRAQFDGRLSLRFGLELGSAPYDGEVSRRILREGGTLDFVLGSIHNWIGEHNNIEIYYTDFTDDPALCRRVMDACMGYTRRLVTEYPDCYDSLAHIVYPIRYIKRDGQTASLDDYEEQVRTIFQQIAQTGHALEVNTCRGTSLDEWRPILRWFKESGGEFVTLGSDAHSPRHLAKGIREAGELLREAGFRYSTTFRERKPVPHPL